MSEKISYYILPILKLLLFVVFVFLCFLPTIIFSQFNFIQELKNEFLINCIGEIGLCLAVFGGLLMVFQIFKNYTFEDIFIKKQNAISGFLKGSLIGFVLILFSVGLAKLCNNVVFSFGNISLTLFFGYLFFYVLVAIFEEFFFRSFPLFVLGERYPIALAIFISSSLFGLAHIGNDGFTWLAMLNITLVGILFSILILQKNNISWTVGIHFSWNFTQGTILGYNDSGMNSPGILVAKPIGPTYLSGGSFGIESSIYCTVVIILVIAFLLLKYKIEPVNEVLLIEEFEEE